MIPKKREISGIGQPFVKRFYNKNNNLACIINNMTRKLRILLGLLILVVSMTLLAWSLWPAEYETRIVPVEPVQMQLPTPSSFLPGPWPVC
jgi:hypothetical protein